MTSSSWVQLTTSKRRTKLSAFTVVLCAICLNHCDNLTLCRGDSVTTEFQPGEGPGLLGATLQVGQVAADLSTALCTASTASPQRKRAGGVRHVQTQTSWTALAEGQV